MQRPAAPASPASAHRAGRTAPRGGVMLAFRRGSGVKTVHVRPTALAAIVTCLMVMMIGFVGSVAWFTFSDDLLSATLAHQQKMRKAYEDRIAALRTQVDLVTSRQLIDQQAVKTRLAEVMARQEELGTRTLHLSRTFGTGLAEALKPAEPAKKEPTATGLRLGSLTGTHSPFAAQTDVASVRFEGPTDAIIESMEEQLARVERQQIAELQQMREATREKATRLAGILKKQGIRIPNETAIGGPLIEMKGHDRFMSQVTALESSLETLEAVRRAAKSLPHGSPTPGSRISSHYGSRRDPFTGRRAVHGGLDFSARKGTPVYATASGVVKKAGRNGGYGKMVEIDHGGGITTRYAHLSRISVKKGQKIVHGSKIGKVGSTGRSTGPHLHYEVRRKGRVLNPIHYVRLGKTLKPLL